MKKRGQFYLIAAIVIIGFLIGLSVVTNYVVEHRESFQSQDLSEELKLESQNIINSGISQDRNIELLVKEFAEQYAGYLGQGQDVIFVYGNEETLDQGYLNYVSLFQVQNSVSLNIGNSRSEVSVDVRQIKSDKIMGLTLTSGDQVTISIDDVNYDFDLRQGENFYFVVKKPIEG
jgi:hypothetical protein